MDKLNEKTRVDPSERRKIILRPRRVDYPRRDRAHNEEYAAEISPLPMQGTADNRTSTGADSQVDSGSKRLGGIALALGVISLFIWSIILGPSATIMGFYAYSRGQKTAGAWAMGLGIVSTLSYFIIIPFAR